MNDRGGTEDYLEKQRNYSVNDGVKTVINIDSNKIGSLPHTTPHTQKFQTEYKLKREMNI